MSCGPAQLVKDIAGSIEQTMDIADKALTVLPLKIASIPGYVEAQLLSQLNNKVKLLRQLLDNPLAALGGLIPGLPADIKGFIDQYAGVAAGVAGTALYLKGLKDKYSDLDVDVDNIVGLLNEVGNDIDLICKIVPNIQNIGGEFVIKGFPVSLPSIDPAIVLKEGKFPDILGQIKDAAKNVSFEFTPDPDNQGVRVSEQPGAPYRINGRPRSNRKRATFLDDLTGGGFGGGSSGFGFVGDILDKVDSGIDSVADSIDNLTGNVSTSAQTAIDNLTN